jgi:formaldehyde-activating enzyme
VSSPGAFPAGAGGPLPRTLDGLIGEGWSGVDPDGAHVNVVLAERGSATAASLLGTFTSPAPGHAPILVVMGATKAEYEPVWPPTIMINKETALEEGHQTITWGAGQLGIGQGVLDAVAENLIPCSGDLVVFVAIYIDPRASDETRVRISSRAATLKGIRTAVLGRDPAAAQALVERRDSVRNPFYSGQ